ncbi:MAG: hypothetical protein AAGA48_17205 [Myxococcota bacterium]
MFRTFLPLLFAACIDGAPSGPTTATTATTAATGDTGATVTLPPLPDTGSPNRSQSCSAGSSVNGESRSMSCTNGACTCTENGVVVGTCSDTSCDLVNGCCAAFF